MTTLLPAGPIESARPRGARTPTPSESATAFARRSFPDDLDRQHRVAIAMTMLEQSDAGREMAATLQRDNVRITVHDWGGHKAGGIADNEIQVEPRVVRGDLANLAATIAHEGEHLQQVKSKSTMLGTAVGGAVLGLAQLATAIPTLGMVDLTGRFHMPGTGLKIGLVQGLMAGTGTLMEQPAYALQNRVQLELEHKYVPVVAHPDGSEKNRLASGASISWTYMGNHAQGRDDSALGRSNLFSTAVPAALSAAWFGASRVMPVQRLRGPMLAAAALTGALAVANGVRLLTQGPEWKGPDIGEYSARKTQGSSQST